MTWFVILMLFLLGMLAIGLLVYTARVEFRRLVVRRLTISGRGDIPSFTIVQFTDVHLGPFYPLSRLQSLVDTIQKEKPELIVFTGDLMDQPRHYRDANAAAGILAKLHAPLGKIAVFGNHDYRDGGKLYTQLLLKAGFTLLKNDFLSLLSPSGGKILVAGLDDVKRGQPDLQMLAPFAPSAGFRLVLVHEPDIAASIPTGSADLILAGHSHGGQVRLPVAGALYTPAYAKKYKKGQYTVNSNALYVDSGLGGTKLPLRFFNPPQFTVFSVGS